MAPNFATAWGAHAARVQVSAARRNHLPFGGGLWARPSGQTNPLVESDEPDCPAGRRRAHAGGVCSPARVDVHWRRGAHAARVQVSAARRNHLCGGCKQETKLSAQAKPTNAFAEPDCPAGRRRAHASGVCSPARVDVHWRWGAHAARVQVSAARRNPLCGGCKQETKLSARNKPTNAFAEPDCPAGRRTAHAGGVCSPDS
jgi:hypothetical protein